MLQAAIPLLALILMLVVSVYLYGEDASYGPNQIALWLAAGVAIAIGFRNKFTWEEIEQGDRKSVV